MELKVQVAVPYGCWDMNLGSLEGQPVLLVTEPSVQSPISDFYLFSFFSKIGVCVVSQGLLFTWFKKLRRLAYVRKNAHGSVTCFLLRLVLSF